MTATNMNTTISAEDMATALEHRRDERLFGRTTYADVLEPDVEYFDRRDTDTTLPEGALEMAIEARADYLEESACPDGRMMHRLGECGCPNVVCHE